MLEFEIVDYLFDESPERADAFLKTALAAKGVMKSLDDDCY